jgi:serine/threonine protein phosphatase PrpC
MKLDISLQVVSAGQTGQDRAAKLETPVGHLFVLADGAGGISGGDAAADLVIYRASGSTINSVDDCINLLNDLDLQLESVGQTTAIIAAISNGKIFGASVGDSCAWLVGTSTYVDLTQAQMQKPLLGSGKAYPIGFGPYDVQDSKIILASDGLFKYVAHNKIFSLVRTTTINDVATVLIDSARLASGALQDDIAVIVADCKNQ